MSRTYTDAELEAVASILLDDYATEYSAGHLSWRDFDGPAARILGAVAPAIIRRDKAEAWNHGFDQGWYAALRMDGSTVPNPYRDETEVTA